MRETAPKLFISRKTGALACGVSLPTFDRLLKQHRVRTLKLGRRVLVSRTSLERLADHRAAN